MPRYKTKVEYSLPESSRNLYRVLFYGLILPSIFLLVYIHQIKDNILYTDLAYEVERSSLQFPVQENKALYVLTNIATIFFPFILSFDKKVHFYRKWKFVLPAILINSLFFILWDVYFANINVWGFNSKYVDFYLFALPLGEWLFFITVPYACIFTHNCLETYIRTDILVELDKPFSLLLGAGLLLIGLTHYTQVYTLWAFTLAGTFLLFHYAFIPNTYRTRYYLSYGIILFPFILVNGVLTGFFTPEPIVVYNDLHHLGKPLGTRFLSIPIDDFAYAFLLLFIPITLFEQLKTTYKNKG